MPSGDYRQLWAIAEKQFTPQDACKWIVTVLRIAHDYDCESLLAAELLQQAEHAALPDLKVLQARYLKNTAPPDIPNRQHSIDEYDQLLSGQWKTREVACG